MRHSRLQRASLLGLWLSLAWGLTAPAGAATFSVTPLRVLFAPDTRSALVTLHNQGTEDVRVQLSLFAWGQDPQGEMQLTPTDDLLFFPLLLTLAPGDRRHIRLGPATPFTSTEKTYRLFVEELPPLVTPAGAPPGIRILTRMGIPIFLQPAHMVPQGRIEGMAVRHGRLTFQVKNSGNVHFVEQVVRVRGVGPTEDTLFDHQEAGWYVLAGAWRIHELALPQEVCTTTRTLVIEVHTERVTLQERFDVPPDACGP